MNFDSAALAELDQPAMEPDGRAMFAHADDPQPLLDAALADFESGNAAAGMHRLQLDLHALRANLGTAWPTVVTSEILTHPVRHHVHRCPMTRHAFARPRGYAGDAVLIDHIYGTLYGPTAIEDAMARAIHHYTVNSPACAAVRHRRSRLAERIDEAAAEPGPTHVLALACGHLREFHLSRAATAGALASFTALDQDPLSLAVVQRELGPRGVTPVEGSVRQLVTGKLAFRDQSLVYAAGLFDYLSDAMARRLVEAMYASLRPGGRMLIANFVQGIVNDGYMESFMNWQLILRTEAEVRALFDGLPAEARQALRIDLDPNGQIAYAETHRA